MDLNEALAYASHHKTGVLITLRRDGRPQSSDIVYGVIDGAIHISVTDARAKTNNLQRDPRCVLHLTNPEAWSYLSFDCVADLSPIAAAADDATVDALVAQYKVVAGDHDDWDDFRRSMVEESRLLLTLTPNAVVGQINSP